MMGLEEHLLNMFKEDFEFTAEATPSHLANVSAAPTSTVTAIWDEDAERELRKIPFFVRGKARRNTERFAADNKLQIIKIETLYEAKAYFAGEAA
jgi:light-independent protochlorophyllide reductase subunit B